MFDVYAALNRAWKASPALAGALGPPPHRAQAPKSAPLPLAVATVPTSRHGQLTEGRRACNASLQVSVYAATGAEADRLAKLVARELDKADLSGPDSDCIAVLLDRVIPADVPGPPGGQPAIYGHHITFRLVILE